MVDVSATKKMCSVSSCADPLHIPPGSSSDTYGTSSDCAYHVDNMKVEKDLEVQEEEMEEVNVKTELGIDSEEEECIGIKDEEGIHSEEEEEEEKAVDTKEEGTPNEQLHVHSAECRYSCDIRRSENLYLCEVCNKAYCHKSSLIKHKRLHSGECPNTCDVCNKAFSQKSTLITHKRIHSGERPYTCDVCNKAFSQKSILIRHRRIHSGERPYTCDLCNKAFGLQTNLKRHQRIHTGERPYVSGVFN